MMYVNVIGAALGAVWIGLGTMFVWFLLNKTKVLESISFKHGLTAGDIRRKFWYFAPALILGGAIIGWQGGPIIVPVFIGEF